MLGNWCFGDYFKKEAIAWAWELLTKVWGMDKSRLHVTVFEGDNEQGLARDDEAAELWQTSTDIDPSHIHLGNKKDNFWEMGETGPCGPCTEIHIDRTPDKSGGKLVNKGTPEVIEIWNLVFIQFNRGADRKLTPLPAKHVDTGMGFERVTAVLQDKSSNYDTDVFTPIFDAIREVTGAPQYTAKLDDLKDTAYRVIADHIRTLTFAMTDGARARAIRSASYVLRSILRRAERYGWQYLGATKPFLCELVPTVVAVMGEALPGIEEAIPSRVVKYLREKKRAFIRTSDRGISCFRMRRTSAQSGGQARISGEDAFMLHDTYGFYIDITEQMARKPGLDVERHGYEQLMLEAGAKSSRRAARSSSSRRSGRTADDRRFAQIRQAAPPRARSSAGSRTMPSCTAAGSPRRRSRPAARPDQLLRRAGRPGRRQGDHPTPTGHFRGRGYPETRRQRPARRQRRRRVDRGRPAGDPRSLRRTAAHDAQSHRDASVQLGVAQVLGEHVEQKGSLVDADKTRFDFAHDEPLSAEEIAEVERLVNEKIYADLPVTAVIKPLEEAKKIPGVRAVFGEKYPDPVSRSADRSRRSRERPRSKTPSNSAAART